MSKLVSVGLLLLLSACSEFTSPENRHATISPRRSISVSAPEAVLPSGFANVMGSSNNNFPHASFAQMRYQQVFLGSDLVDSALVALCLRRDDVAFPFSSREKILTIRMGPTSLDHTSLTSSFDMNYSAPPTEVFSGPVTIPAVTAAGTPVDFDFCIPFTQQYDHTPGANLIVEVVNTSLNFSSSPRDACNLSQEACTTARAWALSPTATTAATVEREGLIMKFISPAPPVPVDPASVDECKKGGWSNFEFRNQGQCVRFVETGFDSRAEEEVN